MTNLWSSPPCTSSWWPRIDEYCRLLSLELEQVAKACEQLAPERARSCRNAITICSVMVDEIRLRAHARPLDEGGNLSN
jgi:hypothetical protein